MFAGEERISGHDLGASKTATSSRAQTETSKPSGSSDGAKGRTGKSQVRTAGAKKSRGGSNTPRRPRNVKPGGGARLLAPLAIIIFGLAAFFVVTGGDSDTPAPVEERTSSSESAAESTADNESSTPTTTRSTYRVKRGDSFAAIAVKLNIDVDVLSELNPDVDPRALQPGQKLKLK